MPKSHPDPSLSTQPYSTHSVSPSLLPSKTFILALILLLLFIVSSLGGFIYFFADDGYYLTFGKENSLIESVLKPGLSGWFRPFLSMPWVVGWSLWETSTWGYQVLISVLVAATTFVLYQIGKQLSGKKAGLIASAFFATYLPMIHCSWWKCSNGYAFEWFFTTLTIYFFIRYHHKHGLLHLLAVFLFGIFSYFSRQSAILLFLILLSYGFFHFIEGKGLKEAASRLVTNDGQRISLGQDAKTLMVPLLLGLLVFFLYLVIEKVIFRLQLSYVGFHPILAIRHLAILFGIEGLFGNAAFIGVAGWICLSRKRDLNRGSLQKVAVPSALGVLLGFFLAHIISRAGSMELLSLGIGTVGSTLLAFLMFFASLFVSDANKRFAISWTLLALIPNMFSELIGYAYTVVSALGMSLFLGLVFSEIRFDFKAVIPGLISLALVLGMISKIQDIPITLGYFKYRVSTGENEKKAIEYLSRHSPRHQVIYGDRENPWHGKLHFMGKAYELGGTVGDHLYTSWMLNVHGRPDLTVKPIGDLRKAPPPVETFACLYDERNLETIGALRNQCDVSIVKQYEMWDDRAMILVIKPKGKGSGS